MLAGTAKRTERPKRQLFIEPHTKADSLHSAQLASLVISNNGVDVGAGGRDLGKKRRHEWAMCSCTIVGSPTWRSRAHDYAAGWGPSLARGIVVRTSVLMKPLQVRTAPNIRETPGADPCGVLSGISASSAVQCGVTKSRCPTPSAVANS